MNTQSDIQDVDTAEDGTVAPRRETTGHAPALAHALDAGDRLRGYLRRSGRAARRVLTGKTATPWYRNRRAVAVLAVVLVIVPAVIALFISLARPKVYAARSEVLFSTEDFVVDEATSETLALIGRSHRVLAPVAEREDMPLADVQRSVSTSVVDTTSVVALEVRRDDPDEAADLARAISEEWVALARRPATVGDVGVGAAIDVETTRLGEIDAELTAGDLSAERRAALEEERADVIERLTLLHDRLSAMEGDDVFLGHSAAILRPARAEPVPVEPQPLPATIAGAVIGLLLAGALVAVAWQLTVRE